MARALTSRPLDLVYVIFFLFHLPASLLVDFQTIYPSQFVPEGLKALPDFYIQQSNDPLIGGLLGYFGDIGSSLLWFKTFIYIELYVLLLIGLMDERLKLP